MENTIKKYTEQLARYKQNRAESVDTNTDAENELYDRLITQLASFVRDLKLINVTHSSLTLKEKKSIPFEDWLNHFFKYDKETTHYIDRLTRKRFDKPFLIKHYTSFIKPFMF